MKLTLPSVSLQRYTDAACSGLQRQQGRVAARMIESRCMVPSPWHGLSRVSGYFLPVRVSYKGLLASQQGEGNLSFAMQAIVLSMIL
ncbi:hypothetical protein D3C81_1714940 [compost metagenome]